MSFQETTRMQERQKLAYLVLEEGVSVSEAARTFGVSRPTAYLWLERARADGIRGLHEESRRPHTSPLAASESVAQAVLSEKDRHPCWGAKKIWQRLWGEEETAPVCVRTVDRLLSRAGQTRPRSTPRPVGRYERHACNELWQMDFKGIPRSVGWTPLSILDDHSRYCLALTALQDRRIRTVWSALWEVFEEAGLPEAVLTDNGDGFNDWQAKGPTRFEANLWLLGIRTCHGRPRHPQTQGKVERFHRTLKEETDERSDRQAGEAEPGSGARSQAIAWPGRKGAALPELLAAFRQSYNWERPHEALRGRVPGRVYTPSPRRRPDRMPVHEVSEGAITRKVDKNGHILFRGRTYRPGKGLCGDIVEIRDTPEGPTCFYADIPIAPLDSL